MEQSKSPFYDAKQTLRHALPESCRVCPAAGSLILEQAVQVIYSGLSEQDAAANVATATNGKCQSKKPVAYKFNEPPQNPDCHLK